MADTGSCPPPPVGGSPDSPRPTSARRLQDEAVRLGRYPLLLVDEDRLYPFRPEAANLFFQLILQQRAGPDRHVERRAVGGARPSGMTSLAPP